MEWFDTNFASFWMKMVTSKIKIELQVYIYCDDNFFKKVKKWRRKIRFFRKKRCFFWNEFRRRNGLFSPLLESRRFTFKTNPRWENLNFSKKLETSHSTCRKALWREYCEIYTDPKVPRQSRLAHETLFKTLHCTSNLSLTWSVKGLSKAWVNVANSYFGAKKSQNQVFTWYKNTGSFSLAFAKKRVVREENWDPSFWFEFRAKRQDLHWTPKHVVKAWRIWKWSLEEIVQRTIQFRYSKTCSVYIQRKNGRMNLLFLAQKWRLSCTGRMNVVFFSNNLILWLELLELVRSMLNPSELLFTTLSEKKWLFWRKTKLGNIGLLFPLYRQRMDVHFKHVLNSEDLHNISGKSFQSVNQ